MHNNQNGVALVFALIPSAAKAEVAVAARLTAQDKIDLKRVEDYLERLSTLKSSFLQTLLTGTLRPANFLSPGRANCVSNMIPRPLF